MIALCIQQHITIQEYTPLEVKKGITGNAKAEKILVQQYVQKIFRLTETPAFADAADALALAYLAHKKPLRI